MAEKFHSLDEKKRPKFLVSWVEATDNGPGMVRGQTVMDRAEVSRLMQHLQSLDTTLYAEARRIGSKISSYGKRTNAHSDN